MAENLDVHAEYPEGQGSLQNTFFFVRFIKHIKVLFHNGEYPMGWDEFGWTSMRAPILFFLVRFYLFLNLSAFFYEFYSNEKLTVFM